VSSSYWDEAASLFSLTIEEQEEEARRKKREKLAKLHRFLGSRVPAELALGLRSPSMLPAVASEDEGTEEERPVFRRRRRRSRSFADYSMSYVKQADRLKSELDVEEKAMNVWRAAKMEKVCFHHNYSSLRC
jgi:hypothetical protein